MSNQPNPTVGLPGDGTAECDYPPKPRVLTRIAIRDPRPRLQPVRDVAAHCIGKAGPVVVRVELEDVAPLLPPALRSQAIASVIWLPEGWRAELPSLLASPLDVANFISQDLIRSDTRIVITGQRRTIAINALLVETGMCTDDEDPNPFVVIWACGNIVHVVRYDLTYDFHVTLQCAHISGGVNYRPMALYSPEQLEHARAAAEARTDTESTVIEAEVLKLRYSKHGS
jgi:hypothetical protein